MAFGARKKVRSASSRALARTVVVAPLGERCLPLSVASGEAGIGFFRVSRDADLRAPPRLSNAYDTPLAAPPTYRL